MWPLLYLHGAPASLPPQQPGGPCGSEPQLPLHWEAEWLGWDRYCEYEYWAASPGRAQSSRCLMGDTPVAVGCTVRNRTMHTLSRLARARRVDDAGGDWRRPRRWCGDDLLVAVPGVNPVVPMLVDAGWRVVEHDLYCASEPDLVDPERLLPHPGLL